jgi:hypothetical protein
MSMVKLRMMAVGAEAAPSPANAGRVPIAQPRTARVHLNQSAGFRCGNARDAEARAEPGARVIAHTLG